MPVGHDRREQRQGDVVLVRRGAPPEIGGGCIALLDHPRDQIGDGDDVERHQAGARGDRRGELGQQRRDQDLAEGDEHDHHAEMPGPGAGRRRPHRQRAHLRRGRAEHRAHHDDQDAADQERAEIGPLVLRQRAVGGAELAGEGPRDHRRHDDGRVDQDAGHAQRRLAQQAAVRGGVPDPPVERQHRRPPEDRGQQAGQDRSRQIPQHRDRSAAIDPRQPAEPAHVGPDRVQILPHAVAERVQRRHHPAGDLVADQRRRSPRPPRPPWRRPPGRSSRSRPRP